MRAKPKRTAGSATPIPPRSPRWSRALYKAKQMPIGTLGLAFVAGTLSVLSPCVLPILPIVLGTASRGHGRGPAALPAGLAVSFTAIGLFVATIGFAVGLDTGVFRTVSAVLLIAVGVVLLVPKLQEQFALAVSPVSNWAGGYADTFTPGSLFGQFGLGLLLGAVWSPCVGPTLGAASRSEEHK